MLRWYPQQPQRFIIQIFLKRAAKPSAGNPSAGFPWVKWPQLPVCIRASQTFSGTVSGTFSGTLLNLTWLCTKASWVFEHVQLQIEFTTVSCTFLQHLFQIEVPNRVKTDLPFAMPGATIPIKARQWCAHLRFTRELTCSLTVRHALKQFRTVAVNTVSTYQPLWLPLWVK